MARSIKSGKILLAEDNMISQKFMGTLLSQWGYEVTLVGNGRAVLEEVKQNAFDILILDYQMPEMDGLATYKSLRAEGNRNIDNMQIVFLTGETSVPVLNELKISGVNYFLRKPIQKEVLFSTLTELMNMGGVQSPKTVSTSTVYLKNITNSNPQLMKEIIDIFIEEAPKFLFKMKTYCLLEDWKSLKSLVHKTKANYTYVGSMKQKELLTELEFDLEFMTSTETFMARIIRLEEITQNVIDSLEKKKRNL
ncbi:response regulator [Litoribacter populi]|uniref:response regulator n=1 Tax=Litoribacter populi TaxID=2598460 RepID=UPI00117C562D|nr:response regulator [Litoribacter populi]